MDRMVERKRFTDCEFATSLTAIFRMDFEYFICIHHLEHSIKYETFVFVSFAPLEAVANYIITQCNCNGV